MKVIYKYLISVSDFINIDLPKGAEILKIDVQNSQVCIWALVDKFAKETELRKFRTFGTGYDINDNTSNLKYINTIFLMNGSLVFHIFEDLS
jgi:hypothetical protein